MTMVPRRPLQSIPNPFYLGYLFAGGVLLLGSILLSQEKTNMPLRGVVMTTAGEPVPEVWVSGGQRQSTKTDEKGQFQIPAPVVVLHFTKAKFEPAFLVVKAGMSDLKITPRPSVNEMKVPVCSLPVPHISRMEGIYGLFFDLPYGEVDVSGGTDVDYSMYVVKPKRGSGVLQFWFGVYAMSAEPSNDQFLSSTRVQQRNVLNPKGQTIGLDSFGTLACGEVWRKTCIVTEGAEYRSSPRDVMLFDRIINSACLDPKSLLAN
jgi:hypothetical protein